MLELLLIIALGNVVLALIWGAGYENQKHSPYNNWRSQSPWGPGA